MTDYNLRPRAAHGTLIGTFVGLGSPDVVETMGRTGFQFLCLDAEHSPLTLAGIADLIRSADLAGTPTIVRLPEVGPMISQVLDAGASGILVPRVESAAQAAEAVGRARYAPEGYRGLGPGRGGFSGGPIPDYTSDKNSRLLITIQIETRAGLEAADEILATPGIDAVIVGPADLAASLGIPIGSPAHIDAVDAIFAAAERQGVAPGAFCFTPEDAASSIERGARVVILGADSAFMASAAAATWSAVEHLTTRIAESAGATK